MTRTNNLCLWLVVVAMSLGATVVTATLSTWNGATSGNADWDDASNWDPCDPYSSSDIADVCSVLTGDRDIWTPATALTIDDFKWTALGTYEDRLTLIADLTFTNVDYEGWDNTADDPCVMTLDLNGYTLQSNGYMWILPDIFITGGGTLDFNTGINITGSPLWGPGVTVQGKAVWAGSNFDVPNMTTTGSLDSICNPGRVTGNMTVDHLFANAYEFYIGGDLTVSTGSNRGLDGGQVQCTWWLAGDMTDQNTNKQYYSTGKLRFNGGGNVQTFDVRRQSGMRLLIEEDSHVVLGSDYYAPYSGSTAHTSYMYARAILDVANHDLTVTDLKAYNHSDVDAQTFIYEAGSDSGSITVLGDDANDLLTTGLWLERFKVEITDGGGWTGGDDFILFSYNEQGSDSIIDPCCLSVDLPAGWSYTSVVHDTSGKRIYLANLNVNVDSDGDGVPDGDDLCPGTPPGTWVDSTGCAVPDSDGDGVFDPCDDCPGTPGGVQVDERGCPDTSGADINWNGASSGTANWNVAGNWLPATVPDTTAEEGGINDTCTGDRNIIVDVAEVGTLLWTVNGGESYENKLTLANNFEDNADGFNETTFVNSSGDASKMVLDLSSYTYSAANRFNMPTMTINGTGTFSLGYGIDIVGTPVWGANVTVSGAGPLRGTSGALPNLTVTGDVTTLGIPASIITGDVQVDDLFEVAYEVDIGGDVTVSTGADRGLEGSQGNIKFNLSGDLTDLNTTTSYYSRGKIAFEAGGAVQTIDVRHQSSMRLHIDPCSYLLLGSDYYAPYSGTTSHGSYMYQRSILDVANHDLTLTDLKAYNNNDADAQTFKYQAGSDSGTITILGDDANDLLTTGLWLERFKVDITDGGGWTGGDDFILFDYDIQGTASVVDPCMLSATLPSGWSYSALVHDTSGKRIYLANLNVDSDSDGVPDGDDSCPGTPAGTWVDSTGCAVPDSDGDGVSDPCDDCPGTPGGVQVDGRGCRDTDGDGVGDDNDLCPGTPGGTQVNADGCPDQDGDGVADPDDQCPGTIPDAAVDPDGCPTSTVFTAELSTSATAWGDYNNDGYSDMFGGNDLWTNNGDGTFTADTPFSGLGNVSLGDYNNDGHLDIMGFANGPELYTNDGDGTWTKDSAKFAAGTNPWNVMGTTWGDFNGDGYLDTYWTSWYSGNLEDVIYTSNDGLSFHQNWMAPAAHGKGVAICDFDEDADIDIYVSNYWLGANFLWRNDNFDGNTGLTEVSISYGVNDGPGHTQGSTWADFDNDGDFDLFISNFAHTFNPTIRFCRNNGSPSFNFTEIGQRGITRREPISAATTGDFDNDGDLDLVITVSSGYGWTTVMVYANNGDFTFTEVTADVGLAGLGPDDAAAFGDYDNDGWLDLLLDNTLFHNPGLGTNHWLKVKLLGGPHADGLVNGTAIGAQVRIDIPGLGTLTRQVEGNTGAWGMQNDQVLHFGLGSYSGATVDLDISWPNGYQETVYDVPVDQPAPIIVRLGGPENCAEVLPIYRLDGDYDGSCDVTVDDLIVMAGLWLADCGVADCSLVDTDSSSTVDLGDFGPFSDNWGKCNKPGVGGCVSNW